MSKIFLNFEAFIQKKHNMKKFLSTLVACIGLSLSLMAQSNIGLDITSIGFDFGDGENADIYKMKVGDGKSTLMEPGLRFSGEVYASDITCLKFAQTLRFDSMNKLAMSSQIMLRVRIFKIYKHSLGIGVGPTAFYRQTWENEPGYSDKGVYSSGSMQTKVNWLSAEMEYNYYLNKHNDLSVCLIHLNPESMGIAIGFKHWISRKSNKCNTCPSFH